MECGLGKALELDLPDETGGLIPHRSFYNQRYGKGKWTRGVLLNLSIGQGEILATPLQMASLMAAVANGGTRYRPHILKEFRKGTRVDFGDYPKDDGQLPLSTHHIELLKRSLRAVVNGPDGTGRLAAVEGVEVAGKTGTAQNPHGEDHAWFVAFAPLDNPKIVVAVLVEHGGHGGVTAAPIAGKIIEAYLRRGGT
jgi:penicillin-binding protein 2